MTVDQQQTADQVRTYFHNVATDFDAIYSAKTSPLMRFLNNWLRKDIYQRYEMTIAECGDVRGKSVLDIGCGSGRYCHELASRGAESCVGIDFAQNMLDLARDIARQREVTDRCQFVQAGYLDYRPQDPYDIAIAIGYFDYIPDAVTHLRKMRKEAREKLVTVFPVAGTVRAKIRKVRLGMGGCPVFFFTQDDVKKLLADSGWELTRMERIGQLWFVVAKPDEKAGPVASHAAS
jgi:SAM-dependent methyltransferase